MAESWILDNVILYNEKYLCKLEFECTIYISNFCICYIIYFILMFLYYIYIYTQINNISNLVIWCSQNNLVSLIRSICRNFSSVRPKFGNLVILFYEGVASFRQKIIVIILEMLSISGFVHHCDLTLLPLSAMVSICFIYPFRSMLAWFCNHWLSMSYYHFNNIAGTGMSKSDANRLRQTSLSFLLNVLKVWLHFKIISSVHMGLPVCLVWLSFMCINLLF